MTESQRLEHDRFMHRRPDYALFEAVPSLEIALPSFAIAEPLLMEGDPYLFLAVPVLPAGPAAHRDADVVERDG